MVVGMWAMVAGAGTGAGITRGVTMASVTAVTTGTRPWIPWIMSELLWLSVPVAAEAVIAVMVVRQCQWWQ